MGVARAGCGRAVAVDVDPNAPKNLNISKKIWKGFPGSPSPHINTGGRSNTAPLNQMPAWGVFGACLEVLWGSLWDHLSTGHNESIHAARILATTQLASHATTAGATTRQVASGT